MNTSSNPAAAAFDGMLYFRAQSAEQGLELWRTDGTERGTTLVYDGYPGRFDGYPSDLTVLGDRLFFFLSSPDTGRELWSTDGTEAGTEVFDLRPGKDSSADSSYASLAKVGQGLFAVLDGSSDGSALWTSDGTAQGTVRLKDFTIVRQPPVDVDGRTFFSASDGQTGLELWTSDGTAEGTLLVRDVYPGGAGSIPQPLAPGATTLFFWAADGVHKSSLWSSRGGPAKTKRIYDFDIQQYFITAATTVDDVVYFLPQLAPEGLWRSDGTAEGTIRLSSMRTTGKEVVAICRTVFFAGDDRVHGEELWASDGTPEGTRLVADINPGPGPSGPHAMGAVRGALFFTANDGQHGYEPWRSDGTFQGTRLIVDVLPGGSGPIRFLEAGDRVYFIGGVNGDDANPGREMGLWVLSDP